jgi:hypothetical protein
MAWLFLGFVGAVAGLAIAALRRYLDDRDRTVAVAVMLGWLTYAAIIAIVAPRLGVPAGQPRVIFYLVPVALFVLLALVRGEPARRIAVAIPTAVLIGAQSFRTIVELFIHGFAQDGLIARTLTFEGANFDILVGLSAPIAAWLYVSGRLSSRGAIAWNAFGLALLANIVARALLSAPGPLQVLDADVPNRAFGMFPYALVPGFLAPLALILHVLSIRGLLNRADAALGVAARP